MVLESWSAGHKNSQIYLLYIRQTFQMVFQKKFSSARREADNDKNKKQLGDTAKLKGNSFYGKMIENLEKHISTKFTTDEKINRRDIQKSFFRRSGRNKRGCI